MFDLPTTDYEERRDYTDFRKFLLQDGFIMLQYSIYVRHCPSEENMGVHKSRIKFHLPSNGEVRLLSITDAQFGRMDLFLGKIRTPDTTKAPQQVELF